MDATNPPHGTTVALLLTLLGVGAAYALAPFANQKPPVTSAAAVSPILVILLLGLPALKCLPIGPRILLILLALRPLVDTSQSFRSMSAGVALASSSGFSLQEGFAAVFGLLLVAVWFGEQDRSEFRKLPNILLILLLGLTSLSWLLGGFSEGVRGFVRTAWGLLVALLLGSLFRTEKQVEVFVRTVFFSSALILMILVLNLSVGYTGTGSDPLWRLGGQYGTPNALAGVALSFFLYGLYVVGRAPSAPGRAFSVILLCLLGVVIVSTQSRTVGALMLMSVCLRLWASRKRWLWFSALVPVFLLLFASATGTGWRLTSSFSLTNKDVDPNLLTLQGRMLLWGEWLQNYTNASFFHKVFGLGWGTMLNRFMAMAFPTSSITESSFLWFLIGTGALGLLTFCVYLSWVLFKSWRAWRNTANDSGKQFALLVFLTTMCFVVEGMTTDVASAPNAAVYIFALISIFVFQYRRRSRAFALRPEMISDTL